MSSEEFYATAMLSILTGTMLLLEGLVKTEPMLPEELRQKIGDHNKAMREFAEKIKADLREVEEEQ